MDLNYIELIVSIIFGTIIWYSYKGYLAPANDKYLTFWPRFWAPTIDEIILWLPTSLIPYIIFNLFSFNEGALNIFYLITVAIFFLYSIYFHGAFGATVGKMVTGVKVVDAKTEERITYYQAFIRDSVPIFFCLAIAVFQPFAKSDNLEQNYDNNSYFSIILGLWFLAEVLTMLTNKKRRALHDYIAGTVVIRYNIDEKSIKQIV